MTTSTQQISSNLFTIAETITRQAEALRLDYLTENDGTAESDRINMLAVAKLHDAAVAAKVAAVAARQSPDDQEFADAWATLAQA
jgi:hypothetical protein